MAASANTAVRAPTSEAESMSEDELPAFVPAFDNGAENVREMRTTNLHCKTRTMDARVNRRNHSFGIVSASASIAVIG
jgi:hypothetical protein